MELFWVECVCVHLYFKPDHIIKSSCPLPTFDWSESEDTPSKIFPGIPEHHLLGSFYLRRLNLDVSGLNSVHWMEVWVRGCSCLLPGWMAEGGHDFWFPRDEVVVHDNHFCVNLLSTINLVIRIDKDVFDQVSLTIPWSWMIGLPGICYYKIS